MSEYRKFYVYVISTTLVGLSVFYDINFDVEAEKVYEFVIMVLGGIGVYAVRNS